MTTVAEVIEELKKYPSNMRVVTLCINSNTDGVWRDFDGLQTGILNHSEPYGLYTGYETEEEVKNSGFDSIEEWNTEKVVVFESRI